jgi:hypothetical protein
MKKIIITLFIFTASMGLAMAQCGSLSQPNPSDQTICYNSTATFNLGPAMNGSGGYAYQWEQSDTGTAGSWSNADGTSNEAEYTTPPLTEKKYYRRAVTSCASSNPVTIYSSSAQITIHSQLVVIPSADQSICSSTAPATMSVTFSGGGSTFYSFQWQKSISLTGTYSDIPGATGATYTETALLIQNTYYCCNVESSIGCTGEHTPISVIVVPSFSATANSSSTICYNTQPPQLSVNVSGSGPYTYRWQQSPTGSSSWTDINNATSSTYQPPALVQTTFYRCVVSVSGSTCSVNSTVVEITVRAQVNANASGNQNICHGAQPTSISVVASGGGTYTYQWQQSPTGTSEWSSVSGGSGGTSANYTPPTLVATTYYRCVVTSTASGFPCTATSNNITISVKPQLEATASENQVVCADNAPDALKVIALGGGGTDYTYQWEQSATGTGDWEAAAGVNNNYIYQAPKLNADTYYRCQVTSGGTGGGCEGTSNIVTITVSDKLDAIIPSSGNQIICYHTVPNPLTVMAAGGGSTIYTYQWQQSATGEPGTWTNISGAVSNEYTPPALNTSTLYRCQVTSIGDNGCTGTSNEVTITVRVELKVLAKDNQIVCNTMPPNPITVEIVDGASPPYTYLWQQSAIGTDPWILAPGDNNQAGYQPPALAATTYFRCNVTSNNNCTVTSNNIQITVSNVAPATPDTPAGETTMCQGALATQYTTTNLISSFQWVLTPNTAGTINGSGNEITISWKDDFLGIANLKVRAINDCGESDFSEPLDINVLETPKATFLQGPESACGNQQDLLYEVEPLSNVSYKWIIDSNYGEFTSNPNCCNFVNVKWKKVNNERSENITAEITHNISKCTSNNITRKVLISPAEAPEAKDIIAKTDLYGTPYMLIYPNPNEIFAYQWVENGMTINSATEQYYYPPNYGRILKKDAEYKVFVALSNEKKCGNYSSAYKLPAQSVAAPPFQVSPNPITNSYFTVSFNRDLLTDKTENLRLTIYSTLGAKIWEQKVNSLDDISITQSMPAGLYMITLNVGDNIYSEKLIINK